MAQWGNYHIINVGDEMRPIALFLLSILTCLPALAAAPYQSAPERQEAPVKDWGPWAGPWRAKVIAMMGVDFGEQYLYAPANAALPPPEQGERRVVFLGDSITDMWDLARFFPGKPYVNRGIGGQVLPQMLVRFAADVAALHPKAVVILGGINDVSGALQVETPGQIEANWRMLAQLAEANGIRPIFTLLLPLNNYTENARHMLEERDPKLVAALNDWLRAFCLDHGYGLIDYGPSLRDAKGMMAAHFTADGLHPNDAAHALMAPVAAKVIEQTVGSNG